MLKKQGFVIFMFLLFLFSCNESKRAILINDDSSNHDTEDHDIINEEEPDNNNDFENTDKSDEINFDSDYTIDNESDPDTDKENYFDYDINDEDLNDEDLNDEDLNDEDLNDEDSNDEDLNDEDPLFSTVKYDFVNSGMPPFSLSGSATVVEGFMQNVFDKPSNPKWTKSTIEVTFEMETKAKETNTLVFTFFRSEIGAEECTPKKPCIIKLGKGSSNAVWYREIQDAGTIMNGNLTGEISITDLKEEPMEKIFKFSGDNLSFNPFG